MIQNLLIGILMGYPLYLIAEWFTWKGDYPNKLRSKFNFLTKKPWTCTKCLSTWMMIFILTIINLQFNIMTVVFNIIFCYVYFLVVRYFSEKGNPIQNNIDEKMDNNKYQIIRTTGINSAGTDVGFFLVVKYDNKIIIDLEFDSISDRESYLKDWAKIFKKSN
jgi:hypothetical protein